MAARETLQAMIALPAPVAKGMLGYMGLFRPHQRALSWKKAKKIVDDLAALIAPGWVQVQGKPSRPCPPHIWAQAMEQMVGRADLQRPLKNHNYLRHVVWQLADQADARQEQTHRRAEVDGTQRVIRQQSDPEEMSEIMRKLMAQQGGQHGTDQEDDR
ncbi:MAG: hypothetical protein LBD10_14615 [Desulfobulbus sp.]|uniref:hypothetical protein n=1 Tax=Desulfobulbus sp. TaxID=895 RepID=UPI0028458CC0|nr:hypothetical protein [Desulfobulbus sp.]MDR2551420.1 hypothetical protein [Desulfobulbus sp.]